LSDKRLEMLEAEERGWRESVNRVLIRANCSVHDKRVMDRVADLARQRVATRAPYHPIALLQAHPHFDMSSYGADTVFIMLLMRGYPVDVSLVLYRNLRLMFPDFTNIKGAWQLMSSQQLVDRMGAFYGRLVANTLAEPEANPALYALLMGKVDDPVCYTYGIGAVLSQIDQRDRDVMNISPRTVYFSALTGVDPGAVIDVRNPRPVSVTRDASSLYSGVTGKPLYHMYEIDPREIDYEEVTQKVRQALCPDECLGRQGDDGERPVFMRRRQDGAGPGVA